MLVALCFAFGAGLALGQRQAGWQILVPVGAVAGIVLALVAVKLRNQGS